MGNLAQIVNQIWNFKNEKYYIIIGAIGDAEIELSI